MDEDKIRAWIEAAVRQAHVRHGGMNGSAAYADIDSGVAVAVMRNRFIAGDFSMVGRIDRIVAGLPD